MEKDKMLSPDKIYSALEEKLYKLHAIIHDHRSILGDRIKAAIIEDKEYGIHIEPHYVTIDDASHLHEQFPNMCFIDDGDLCAMVSLEGAGLSFADFGTKHSYPFDGRMGTLVPCTLKALKDIDQALSKMSQTVTPDLCKKAGIEIPKLSDNLTEAERKPFKKAVAQAFTKHT